MKHSQFMNCVLATLAMVSIGTIAYKQGEKSVGDTRAAMHSDHAGLLARGMLPLIRDHVGAEAELLGVVMVAVTSDGHTGVISYARGGTLSPPQMLDAAISEMLFSRKHGQIAVNHTPSAAALSAAPIDKFDL